MLVVQELGKKETDRIGVVAHEHQVKFDQAQDLFALIERARLLGEIDKVRLEQTAQYRHEELFLGLEMPEDERFTDVGFARHFGHRSFVKAAIREETHRGPENLVAR